MDALLYDVYLTGKLADDVSPALAAQRLAALFKSTPAAMSGLITGKAQLLKRGVDKNTALKYRDALQNAGCEIVCKAQTSAPSVAPAAVTGTNPAHSAPAATTGTSGLNLAPMEGDLLRPDEHTRVVAAVIATSHLSLAPVGPLPAVTALPISPPDTSHLSVAAASGNLVDASERETPPAIAPDTSTLSLAEVGATLETLKSYVTPLQPDTSGLQLAPAGSDLLTPEQRQHPQPAAPKTDHISLAT